MEKTEAMPTSHRQTVTAAGKRSNARKAANCSTVTSFPRLAGQHRDYLLQALHEYKIGVRKNPIMGGQVQALSDTDMQDLATYFSEQKGLTLKY